MTELRALTGARGVAAWLVVFYHIRGGIADLPPAIETLLAKGYLAVDFFFLLSGFVIWLTWHDRLRAPGAIPLFLRKRIARVWPLHATMLACAVALALLLRATGRHDPAFPFAELPLHVLLVQNWGGTDMLRWNDPAWSISCEFAAYLAFPLLVLAVDWRRLPGWGLAATIAVLLVALHLAMRGAASLGSDIPRLGLVRCLAEFATGTLVAALYLRRPSPAWPLAVAAIAAGGWALGVPETLAVPAMFAAALLALALTAGRPHHPLEGRAVHALGVVSYATYLSHFLLWKAFRLPLGGSSLSMSLIALYLALVLAASFVLYRLVERPAQRLLATPRPGARPRRGRGGRVTQP
ncbi:acyltransferase [Sphingomonas sp. A2-49]|uniref:acyltransferase family protein n=1 Tax=Sphingomonas sp. A2-49 TaxID=1391375 RepID=UPI0021D0316C|nr:acyltransferase [Sphingomonas sp. A2-49]MCU6455405.1 acyltransferase [Sphingomonas sp. A2-49]